MNGIQQITDEQFNRFRKMIYEVAGISMADEKKMLVASRLAKRLNFYKLDSYGKYYQLVNSPQYPGEFQMMVDLLTTNETYFFRESQHFDLIKNELLKGWRGDNFRVWSAASSSGEEVYTIAMILAETIGARPWEVLGSDISSRVLNSCRQAVYPISRAAKMPQYYLQKYCLKGMREQEGMLLIDKKLRSRCRFEQINLMQAIPNIGMFDMLFLRNVMIYFNHDTKVKLVDKLLAHLKPGGYLFISHSETLHNITDKVKAVKPSVYQKPGPK
jgi:chemotaxis protein methyltransferase CheR